DNIIEAESLTAANSGLQLNIAVNYGGRWDIAQACQSIAQQVVDQKISVADINAELVDRFLSMAELPDPDLFIRTGGEHRISNFLMWQLAYSELYFCDELWPEFNEQAFDRAIESFAGRQRRFGQTGEQVETINHG
ncbi:MAG: polyprenyl diphosphate synthase, partial [Gammaproteobacteria bacterium]